MPASRPDRVRVAIVQHPPKYLDLPGTLDSMPDLLHAAATQDGGADLVVFGETWFCGYPVWVDVVPGWAEWDSERTKSVYATLRRNSLAIGSPEHERLASIIAKAGVGVVIGTNERVDAGPGSRTLYNSLLTFGANGTLLNHHRKLVPTYTERCVWGPGDAAGLKASEMGGVRVGSMVCWEHWMPLPRQVLHEDAEDVHVAVWPTAHERHQIASRQYALEGRCFVLAAGQLMRAGELEPFFGPVEGHAPDDLLMSGGSAIIGPDGEYLVEPVFDREAIIRAELDLTAIDRESITLDVTGHYARPELFSLEVNRQRPTR